MNRRGVYAGAVGVAILLLSIGAWITYPWTKHQCYRWAAERQLRAGMVLAEELCEQRFGPLVPP